MPPRKSRGSAPGTPAGASWALKRADGEMFSRSDIQYNLLCDIFNDETFQFSSAVDQRPISFSVLYLETLTKCGKAAKNTLRQMEDHPDWALNFCIACFLVNIGRINTTVAFYPELRAYMRTYHPIPSLQRDEFSKNNLQDAPRIKTLLKSCCLPYEGTAPTVSLTNIAKRSAEGFRPPTTVVNLIFEMFAVESFISARYFPEGFGLHDLFTPSGIPSKHRAYAFLWLMHHFLEDPNTIKDFENDNTLQPFSFTRDPEPEAMPDPPEEMEWGKEMQSFRLDFLKKWRGEEGLAATEEQAAEYGTPMTKRQKMIAANFANAIEAEEQSLKVTRRPSELSKGACVYTAESDPREGLVATAQILAKLRSLPDDEGPQEAGTTVQRQFRRMLKRDAAGVDPADDSDTEVDIATHADEMKGRLIGFNFPQPNGRDIIVRFGQPPDGLIAKREDATPAFWPSVLNPPPSLGQQRYSAEG